MAFLGIVSLWILFFSYLFYIIRTCFLYCYDCQFSIRRLFPLTAFLFQEEMCPINDSYTPYIASVWYLSFTLFFYHIIGFLDFDELTQSNHSLKSTILNNIIQIHNMLINIKQIHIFFIERLPVSSLKKEVIPKSWKLWTVLPNENFHSLVLLLLLLSLLLLFWITYLLRNTIKHWPRAEMHF